MHGFVCLTICIRAIVEVVVSEKRMQNIYKIHKPKIISLKMITDREAKKTSNILITAYQYYTQTD